MSGPVEAVSRSPERARCSLEERGVGDVAVVGRLDGQDDIGDFTHPVPSCRVARRPGHEPERNNSLVAHPGRRQAPSLSAVRS